MMNRRDFIKCGLATGLLLGSEAMFAGCSGLRRNDLSREAAIERPATCLDPRSRSMLQHASLAPSGHNSQPWRVKIESSDQWTVEADPARRLPCVDPDNRELLLSLGAFIENLSLAAGSMGLRADVRVIVKGSHDRKVARVTFRSDTPSGYPLKRLQSRRTVRHGLLSRELTARDVGLLAGQLPGRLVYFPRGSGHAACIRDAAVENYRIQAGRDDAQQELVDWLRLSDRDVRRYRDGLSTEGMEIFGFQGWFVRQFVRPEDFLKENYRRKGIEIIAELAGQGGGWLVITSQGQSVPDLIETGRRFQRMALLARERSIGIHPMTQLLEEKAGIAEIAGRHGASFFPQFVLRVGYLKRYPDPVSLRRPVEWFASA